MDVFTSIYAVSERGRKLVECPVCGKIFLSTPQWIYKAFINRRKRLVCSHHCTVEAKRKKPKTYAQKGWHKSVPVICIETGKTYGSIKEAAAETGCAAGNISAHILGQIPHVKGLHFMRADGGAKA